MSKIVWCPQKAVRLFGAKIIVVTVIFACFLPAAALAADNTVSNNDLVPAAALAADNTVSNNDLLPAAALAADNAVSSNDLIDKAAEYDGQTVVYISEVIGDIMTRGEYTWLNVSDGSNAIGIWVKSDDARDIKTAGRYDARGDIVKITGVFRRACAEHGGDFDIHAESVEIAEKGYPIAHTVEAWKVISAAFLFAGAIVCMAFVLRGRLKSDK